MESHPTNRNFIDLIRSMLKSTKSKFPQRYWAEIMVTAAYIYKVDTSIKEDVLLAIWTGRIRILNNRETPLVSLPDW